VYALAGLLGLLCIGAVLFIARTKQKTKKEKTLGRQKSRFTAEYMDKFGEKLVTTRK
jgi:hypothetical protein